MTFREGLLAVSQKTKYDSAWDLTDAVYYFAEQAVQQLKFDLRDEFTYLTLSDEVLSSVENLRTLELTKSVVVFANDAEKEGLLASGELPIINSKRYSYLTPGNSGGVVSAYSDFIFIKDKNGYDSNSVVITDVNGNSFTIEYNISVGEQLKSFGCCTGIITIEEKTIYGDTTTYQAVYIAENDNSARVELHCYENKTQTTKNLDFGDNNSSFTVNAFSIKSIVDELDPYGIITISKDGVEEFYCISENTGALYTEKGSYTVTLVNRLGYSYTFTINIDEELYYTTELSGGVDGSQYIMYSDGDLVNLPQLAKYGYTFAGYKAANGNIYSEEVQAILLKGSSVLEVVWVAKQFNMTLQMDSGVYEEQTITFGETYTLPTLATTNNQRFLGWKDSNGEFVSSFTVEQEGDICLIACFETIQETTEKEQLRDTLKSRAWWVWVILIVLAILGLIGCCGEGVGLGFIGLSLLALSILCMIWPSAFWWFIWWYY